MLKIFLQSKAFYVRLTIILILVALSNYGLIMILTSYINGVPNPVFLGYEPFFFFGFLLLLAMGQKYFQTYLVLHTNNMIYNAELNILSKLRKTNYSKFEKLGSERVYTIIEDILSVSELPTMILTLMNAGTIVMCCIIYMFSVSIVGTFTIIGFTLLLAVFYIYRQRFIVKKFAAIRKTQDKFFLFLDDVLRGFKELKLNLKLNNKIFNDSIKSNRDEIRNLKIDTSIYNVHNEIIGNFAPYLLLGVAIFLFGPLMDSSTADIASFIILLMYLINPLTELVSAYSNYPRIKVTFDRIDEFQRLLEKDESFKEIDEIESCDEPKNFESLRLEGVGFEYWNKEKNKKFILEPVDLEIKAGEVIFFTGGNGSGKSTLLNIIAGVYKPSKGAIFLNNKEVDYRDYQMVKDLISAVFTDYHLFRENYLGLDLTINNKLYDSLQTRLRMNDVLDADGYSNKSNLSKGQQKRLALIFALLDQNPILILDEWAAEQDPGFTHYFYHDILNHLREMKITVLLVTHDDQYYECADRVLKFNYGNLEKQELNDHQLSV